MTGTGNDIVALKAINVVRTKQSNFYSKILSAAEKTLYDEQFANTLAFENFVWLLWSVKESAYKYLQRFTPELVFSPTRVSIQTLAPPAQHSLKIFEGATIEDNGFDDQAGYKGVVKCGSTQLYSRSIINHDFIFSVVNGEDDFTHTCWGIRLIDSSETEYQSKAVRKFLIDKLDGLFPDMAFTIEKSPEGIPALFNGTEVTNIPVSLAHHDRYIAYSFQLK
ncbi:MAG TPA: 4'-phosphopantetheinyl transferase superfamily protein [Mucilaginibacter sp.]|nr:4'-phosphopantetheinyl transferase superfamily protein [Mucilaginibacter sp.]